MGKKEKNITKVADVLDLPLDALCNIPKTEIIGNSEVSVENFRGIIDYNENSFKINTQSGIIKIDGSDLVISSITDEGVRVRGTIIRLEFI